jgi:hypothetical protein
MKGAIVVAALCVASVAFAQAAPAKKAGTPAPAAKKAEPPPSGQSWDTPAFATPPTPPPEIKVDEDASIIVTLRHLNGEVEHFSRSLDSMDLIFEPNGKMTMVHLILITGTEKDAHRWYQVQNLAYFSYRFLNLAGKGKVRLKMLAPFTPDKDDSTPQNALPSLSARDYR